MQAFFFSRNAIAAGHLPLRESKGKPFGMHPNREPFYQEIVLSQDYLKLVF